MKLRLYKYNNYFNRIVKKENSLAQYPSHIVVNNINFNPNNGVNTSIVVGTDSFDGERDYCILCDDNNNIVSRWFILEGNRTRAGQYELQLRRDVLVDFYDKVMNATAYIQKGNVQADDPLLFNKEGLDLNQIKQQEILLKDKSTCPWIVGYVDKGQSHNDITIDYDPARQDYISVSASNIANWEFYQYQTNPFRGDLLSASYSTRFQKGTGWAYDYNVCAIISKDAGMSIGDRRTIGNAALRAANDTAEVNGNKILAAYNNITLAKFNQVLRDKIGANTAERLQTLLAYNGKTIKTTDGKYYSVQVLPTGIEEVVNAELIGATDPLYSIMTSAAQASGAFATGYTTPDNDSFKYSYKVNTYTVIIAEDKAKTVKCSLPSGRAHTKDSLYDIFCIPYGDLPVSYSRGGAWTEEFRTNKQAALAAAMAIGNSMGSALYDIQLLPYCPVQSAINSEGQLTLAGMISNSQFSLITDTSTNPATFVGVILYATSSSFTLNIDQPIDYPRYKQITGFTNITVPTSTTISPIRDYTDYVLQNLNTPASTPQLDPSLNTYNIRTYGVDSTHYDNNIKVSKINKTTGKVIDSYMASELEVRLFSDVTQNIFSTKKTVNNANVVIESFTYAQYNALDYYIVYSLNNNSWGGRGVTDVWVPLSRIPQYSYNVTEATALKLDNECRLYRLVSPNYSGEFEFSVAKNKGIDFFNVDCTYKPFNPYIHVNPNFKGLYGADFDDSRGLICNGDFSFGQLTSAFANYELQNKNYQNIFNRQIQNLDVNNAIARTEAGWQIAAGTVQGTTTGIIGGAMAGGGWGAAIGGVAGFGTSLAGGLADYQNLIKRQGEEKSFAIDNYNYSLQNIKAMPLSIAKCSALTYNNKFFPFVEVYNCTEKEEEAMIDKLKYDGMTVSKIDKIINYIGDDVMVRADLIRIDLDDGPTANEVYAELQKGVFF